MFIYNTWFPFNRNIDHDMILELSDSAADCGFEEFIIDDGWQIGYGDWDIDSEKFPNGLKVVFDHIKSNGMKPGLWISLAGAERSSNVFKKHPKWFVEDPDNDVTCLHVETDQGLTGCMSTGWKDYIGDIIVDLVDKHGLAYAKLDFAIVTSGYMHNDKISGCYAKDHPNHSDRAESFEVNYRQAMNLFDDLHKKAPDLFIDCTYETMGKHNTIDYGVIKHAEGDWLSNIQEDGPIGPLRVRKFAWLRSPAIPASTLVMGNLRIDADDYELSLKSLAGALPIFLGDPRELSKSKRKNIKDWSDWLKDLQKRHSYMSFRQDLPGFGEPQEGAWDGYQRINTETKSGGLVGVFRHGSYESERVVTVNYLHPEKVYEIRKGKTGKLIVKMTGRDLKIKGFKVELKEMYDGELFEIRYPKT
jgi:alpha-galactosidase